MAALDLPESTLAAVWRLVKARFESCQKLIDAGVDVEFDEDRDAVRGSGDFPADRVIVQVSGGIGPWSWAFAHEHAADLLFDFTVTVRSLDFADIANLQAALFLALYDDPDSSFQTSLTNVGAAVGQPIVSRSLNKVGTDKNNNFVVLSGQMVLRVESPIESA